MTALIIVIKTALIIAINVLLFYVYFQAGLLTLMDTYLPAGVKQSDKKMPCKSISL